ncbi:hypothetical protein ULF88_13780 [Halopseudomonas pachastrellae]|nr:hypothetical protein [Halopseudomonas pachastrellae]
MISFIVNIAFLGLHELPWYGTLAVILATGGSLGFGLNLGHEMGHKKTTLERWLAKITLALGVMATSLSSTTAVTTAMLPPRRPGLRAHGREYLPFCLS